MYCSGNDITRIDIVSKADFEESKDQMITTPVGTGPYKVTGYTPGVEVVLRRMRTTGMQDKPRFSRGTWTVSFINLFRKKLRELFPGER